jgi:chromosome segregation ATPase
MNKLRVLVVVMTVLVFVMATQASAYDKCSAADIRYQKALTTRNGKTAAIQAKRNAIIQRLTSKQDKIQNSSRKYALQKDGYVIDIEKLQEQIAANTEKINAADPNTQADLIASLQAKNAELQAKIEAKQQKIAELDAKLVELEQQENELGNLYMNINNEYDQKIRDVLNGYAGKIDLLRAKRDKDCRTAGAY